MDEESAGEPCDTREEAVEDFYNDDNNEEVLAVDIGHPEYFVPEVHIDNILDQLQCDAWHDLYGLGEYAKGYLENVKDEHKKELRDELNEVLQKWEKRHGYSAAGYVVWGTETFNRIKMERSNQ